MRHVIARALIVAVGVSLHAGCASTRAEPIGSRRTVNRARRTRKSADQARPEAPPQPTLEETIGKVRRLMSEARPETKNPAQTIEASDPGLAAALAVAAAQPTAETYVEIASIYHKRGLLDRAYDYYTRALRTDRRSSESYEGLARVWRDWGLAHLALGDAHRAIYHAPSSASAHNTLGTVLQVLGQRDNARRAYTAALDAGSGGRICL